MAIPRRDNLASERESHTRAQLMDEVQWDDAPNVKNKPRSFRNCIKACACGEQPCKGN